MTRKETFGQRLRRLREASAISQRQLAGPGVSAAYISRLEKDERNAMPNTIEHLASRLGVSPYYLETGDKKGDLYYITDEELEQGAGSGCPTCVAIAQEKAAMVRAA